MFSNNQTHDKITLEILFSIPKEVFCIFPYGFLIRRNGFHASFLPTPPSAQTHPPRTGFPQDKLGCVVTAGQRGDTNLGEEEGWGVKRSGGGMGKTWEPNTGWGLAKGLKAQGLKMTSQVAWEDLCLVCSKHGAKIIFLWLTFGCTAISHPGEGISCLVTYFRKSSLLPRDNKQHGEGKISQSLHFSTQTSLAQHQVPRRGFLGQTAHFCSSLHCSGCSSHVSGFEIPVPALPRPKKSYMAFLSSGPHLF